MTTLFRPRQRAEEFAARLDGPASVRPVAGAGTERLLTVAQLLRAQGAREPTATPRDGFAADLRERLMAEAATVLTPQHADLALPARTRGRRERRLVAVASAAVLIGGTAGMASAAQSALPGEALYPVKRGIEKAEAGLSISSAGRGSDLLHQASRRLDEVRGLVEDGSVTGTPQVPHTLAAFTSQAQEGADLLLASYEHSRDPKTIAGVREFAATALRGIDSLSGTAPAEAEPGLRDAALALLDIDSRAGRLCDTCSDLPPLRVPAIFSASAEVDRAMRQLDVAGLDNSHPVVAEKQAVHRADAAARSGNGARRGSGASAPQALRAPRAPRAAAPPQPTKAAGTDGPVPVLPGTGATPKVKVKVNVDRDSRLGEGLGDAVQTLLPDATELLP